MTPLIIGGVVFTGLWLLTRDGEETAVREDPQVVGKELLDLGADNGELTKVVTLTDGTEVSQNEGGESKLVDVGFAMDINGDGSHVECSSASGGEISCAELAKRIEQGIQSGYLGDLIV